MPLTLQEYEDEDGDSPFADWFDDLPVAAATRVTMALARMERGNMGDAKSVGNGVIERRIDHGPGYRIYLGRDGATLVILLAGGTKQRQDRDIETAVAALGRLPPAQTGTGETHMPLTRAFRDTVAARVKRDPEFREALLTEAVQALISGEPDVGKSVLRDYINATIGFPRLAAVTSTPEKSLMRMLSPDGNPQARNLCAVIEHLQKETGVRLAVTVAR